MYQGKPKMRYALENLAYVRRHGGRSGTTAIFGTPEAAAASGLSDNPRFLEIFARARLYVPQPGYSPGSSDASIDLIVLGRFFTRRPENPIAIRVGRLVRYVCRNGWSIRVGDR